MNPTPCLFCPTVARASGRFIALHRFAVVAVVAVTFCLPALRAVERWRVAEISFTSSVTYSNSFMDVSVTATFTGPGGSTIVRPAFWAGGNTFKVRFAPTLVGTWNYTTSCSDTGNAGLHNRTGSVSSTGYSGSLPIYQRGFLKVSPSKRYFSYDDGTPFFYLADTMWTMHTLRWSTSNLAGTTSQFKHIVDTRVAQNYSVMQTHANRKEDYCNAGCTILTDPAGAFWTDLDNKFAYIANSGLVNAHGILAHNAVDYLTPDGAARLAKYITARWGAYPMFWITSQEVDLSAGLADKWKPAAVAFNANDAYNHPQTGHMNSPGSPKTWGTETWHDWFMTQGGHGSIRSVAHYKSYYDYAPTKPFLDSEANYEGIIPPWDPVLLTAVDVRNSAYKSVQSGGAGFGYGGNGLWNDGWAAGQTGCCEATYGFTYWGDALAFNGGDQVGLMKDFYTSLQWWLLVPRFADVTWASFANPEESNLSTNGNSVYVVYFYRSGTTATGTLKNMDSTATYKARWFNPRIGTYTSISTSFNPGGGTWAIPVRSTTEDWALVVEKLGAAPVPAVSRWRFDETSGSVAADANGPNPGTLLNGAVFASGGIAGNAATLAGDNDYINVPDASSLEGMGQLTVSVWVRLAAYPASGFFYSPMGKESAYRLVTGATGVCSFALATSGTSWYQSGSSASSTTALSLNTWHHIAAVYDGANTRIYVNGNIGATVGTASGAIVNNTSPLRFGFAAGSNIKYLNGRVDEARVYPRALSAAEVATLFGNATVTP